MRSPERADLSSRISATGSKRATRPGGRAKAPRSGGPANCVPSFHDKGIVRGAPESCSRVAASSCGAILSRRPILGIGEGINHRNESGDLSVRCSWLRARRVHRPCEAIGRAGKCHGGQPGGSRYGGERGAIRRRLIRSGTALPVPQRTPGSEGESVAAGLSCHFLHSEFEPRFVLRRQR